MIAARGKTGRVWVAVLFVCIAVAVPAGCSYFAPRGRAPGPVMTPDGVRFRYYAPEAIRVQLAASWPENNWARGDGSVGEADIGLMTVDADGMWEVVVPLGSGRYTYLFWVDENTWHLDPGNSDHVAGGPREKACLLVIFMRDDKLEIR